MTAAGALAPFAVSAFGVRVRIEFADGFPAGTAEEIRRSWAGALLPDAPAPETCEVIEVATQDDLESLVESLTVRVTLAALARRSGELAMFHACGIADPEGRVAAFVGPSGRGKTTLSRALGAHYGYVSDETIGVDADLAVSPYRKPLSVVRPGRAKEQVAPGAAGLLPVPDVPLRLGALVLLNRDAERPAPAVEALAFPEAIAEIAPQMSYLAELPRPLQTLAMLCDRIGGVVRLTYPDAATVPALVPALFDHDRVHEQWASAGIEEEHPEFDLSGVTDAIRCGDRVVVLAHRWVHVLDGIAPVIWDSLRAGRRTDEIVDDVIAHFGQPAEGDPRDLVVAALDRLAEARVLTRRS